MIQDMILGCPASGENLLLFQCFYNKTFNNHQGLSSLRLSYGCHCKFLFLLKIDIASPRA